jgi:hypothetical protein
MHKLSSSICLANRHFPYKSFPNRLATLIGIFSKKRAILSNLIVVAKTVWEGLYERSASF